MRTTNRKHYRPYIRRANGREIGQDLRTNVRLAFYASLGRPFYVLVQHGFPNSAALVGPSRRDIIQSILGIALGKINYRQWTKEIQRRSRGW